MAYVDRHQRNRAFVTHRRPHRVDVRMAPTTMNSAPISQVVARSMWVDADLSMTCSGLEESYVGRALEVGRQLIAIRQAVA